MRISEWSSDVCSSDLWYALPEAGVGAVILTNADPGAAMLGPFLRRLLEVLYDGQPEAARDVATAAARIKAQRSEEHTSELQSLMRISYAVFCLKKKKQNSNNIHNKKQSIRVDK